MEDELDAILSQRRQRLLESVNSASFGHDPLPKVVSSSATTTEHRLVLWQHARVYGLGVDYLDTYKRCLSDLDTSDTAT